MFLHRKHHTVSWAEFRLRVEPSNMYWYSQRAVRPHRHIWLWRVEVSLYRPFGIAMSPSMYFPYHRESTPFPLHLEICPDLRVWFVITWIEYGNLPFGPYSMDRDIANSLTRRTVPEISAWFFYLERVILLTFLTTNLWKFSQRQIREMEAP